MRLFGTETGGMWVNATDVCDDNGEVEERGTLSNIQSFLSNCLTSTNLVVLSGLGTSLCINNKARAGGQPTAPTMWDLWQAAREKAGEAFEPVLSIAKYAPEEGSENIEELLSRCKVAIEYLDEASEEAGKVANFVAETEDLIRNGCDFVGSETPLDVHETFLARVGRRSARKPRTKIFTTNYDKCFEEAARRRRFVVTDGFSFTNPPTYDPGNFRLDIVRRGENSETPDFMESVVQLYKLHGSVDWARNDREILRQDKPSSPLLIYPRSSKYEQAFEAPYLDMMSSFQSAIRTPDTALLIIGFGFNDDHISRPVIAALQANLSIKLAVCDPGYFSIDGGDENAHSIACPELDNPYHQKLKTLIDAGDHRIKLIRTSFEELVPTMPDLVAESERERHAARFRATEA